MCGGGGKGLLQLAALAATVYTGGAAAGLWGGAEAATGAIAGSEAFASGVGAAGGDAIGSLMASNAANWGITVAPEIAALGGSAAELAALAGPSASAAGATGAAGTTEASTGAKVVGGLKTAAQLAPLASLAMAAQQPKMDSLGVASPTAPPTSQAAKTPNVNIFKKKLSAAGDPTQTSGPGGVTSLSLGKATVLGQ